MKNKNKINETNKTEQQREHIKKQTMQHLKELQPKRNIDVDTKVLTRNYLDRVYETSSMKNKAREDEKKRVPTI